MNKEKIARRLLQLMNSHDRKLTGQTQYVLPVDKQVYSCLVANTPTHVLGIVFEHGGIVGNHIDFSKSILEQRIRIV